jgi:hypothetical protein
MSIVCVDTFVDAEGEVRGKSGRLYRFEFSWMFGPSLTLKNGELCKNQTHLENEHHEFWKPFEKWLAKQKKPRKA